MVKDYYCLRKEIRTFMFVTTGIVIVALLFFLSLQYGNLARGVGEMETETQFTGEELEELLQIPIMFMLMVPIGFVSNIVECFRADEKAGFSKQLYSMPLTSYQIAGARYFSCILFLVISLFAAMIAALLMTFMTDTMKFGDMFGCSMTFAAFFLFYMSIMMPLLYSASVKMVEKFQIGFVVLLLIAMEAFFATKLMALPEAEGTSVMMDTFRKVKDFLTNEYIKLFLMAGLGMLISYFVSVQILEKRKGEA